MRTLLDYLYIMFHPSFWLQNHSYSVDWDILLNELLSKYKFEFIDFYTVKLGDIEIWSANYPYATFIPFCDIKSDNKGKYTASRRTILRAYRKMLKDIPEFKELSEISHKESMEWLELHKYNVVAKYLREALEL